MIGGAEKQCFVVMRSLASASISISNESLSHVAPRGAFGKRLFCPAREPIRVIDRVPGIVVPFG